MNNLHISLTEFTNESRVLKQTESMVRFSVVDKVYIAALHRDELDEDKAIDEKRFLKRFKLSSRNWSKFFLVQVFKYFEFMLRVTFYYRKKNIRIVNIHSLALLPFGVLLKYLYGARLVYDTHELETEVSGLIGFRKEVAKKIEKILIKRSDIVFCVSENIADWYAGSYEIKRPVVVLNSPKKNELKNSNIFRESLQIAEHAKIVLYQGSLSAGRGVDLLLETFQMRLDNDIVVVFMGYGELENRVKKAAERKENIFFVPAVSSDLLLGYTSSSDIGIHMIENTCLNHFYCMPNKIFEYAMAGLPVLVSDMKEMREMVERYEMGGVVKEETPEKINQAIEKIFGLDMAQMKANARRCAEENAWEMQEVKMLAEYRRVLNGK